MTIDAKPGWTGQTLPIEAQGLVLMRKYAAAVEVVARNTHALHKEVKQLLEGVEEGGVIADKLSEHPFFIRCMNKLMESEVVFGDKGFRRDAAELFAEARDELEDMITWMAIGLWVYDGADFPEGLLEQVEGESDEEE